MANLARATSGSAAVVVIVEIRPSWWGQRRKKPQISPRSRGLASPADQQVARRRKGCEPARGRTGGRGGFRWRERARDSNKWPLGGAAIFRSRPQQVVVVVVSTSPNFMEIISTDLGRDGSGGLSAAAAPSSPAREDQQVGARGALKSSGCCRNWRPSSRLPS